MTKKKAKPPVTAAPVKVIKPAELPIEGVNAPASLPTLDGKSDVFKSPSKDISEAAEFVMLRVNEHDIAKEKMNAAKRKLLQLMEFEKVKRVAVGETAIEIREGEDKLKFVKAQA